MYFLQKFLDTFHSGILTAGNITVIIAAGFQMDAFTGKEQNCANVVPMVCQFEDQKENHYCCY